MEPKSYDQDSPEVTKSTVVIGELRAELWEVATSRRAYDPRAFELEHRPEIKNS